MLKQLLLVLVCAALSQSTTPAPSPAMAEATKAAERLTAFPTNAERRQAIEAQQIPVNRLLMRALNDHAQVLLNAHDFKAAEEWMQLALGYSTERQDAYSLAMTFRSLSEVTRQTNDYDKALDYQLRSLDWARKANDGFWMASGLANYSAILRKLGSEEESLAAARDALAAAEAYGYAPAILAAHTTLANGLGAIGDYRSALEHHNQAVVMARAAASKSNEAISLCNIADVYRAQGDLALAIDTFQRCIPMAEEIGYTITEGRFRGSLADTYVSVGNLPLAKREAEKSLALGKQLNHGEIIGGAYGTLADIAWAEGRKLDAIALLDEAVRVFTGINNQDMLAGVLPSLGRYQVGAGQIEKGLATLDRARNLSRAQHDRAGLYSASAEAGKALRAQGRAADARAAFDEAIRAVEGVRDDVAGTIAQTQFLSDKLDPYHEMVALAAADGSVDEAFRFAERGRTQALVGALRGGRVSTAKVMTAAERTEESQLRQRIAAATFALEAAKDKGGASADLPARVEKARTAYAEFERTLYAAHPELRTARLEVAAATTADAAAALVDPRAALLEFIVSSDKTYLFVIKKDAAPKLLTLPVGAARLATLVKQLQDKVAARALDYRASARELDRILLEPARSAIDTATTIVIVPDGPLWRLPFAVLESAAGAPLVEKHAVFAVPSVTVLREVQSRHRALQLKTLLAVGNPPGAGLASVDAGFDALSNLYGAANARLLTGPAASESAFKANAGRYDVVQLASHGVLDDGNPLYSYVSLAKGAGEDGFLEAREMADLDLHAQLVVLSACETARGGLSGGEGLMGMTWALFLAGSPATVASGWKVDEAATSQLMLALHRHLRKGEPRAAALRSAALEVRSEPRYRHPFYWAAFVLSGDGF